MIKMIVGLFTGMILTGVLFIGPLSPFRTMAQAEDSSLVQTQADNTGIYHESLISPLQKAGDEIQDSDIGQFYRKLLREYELDEPSPGTAQDERSSMSELLPDIKRISYSALTLPLQEAGKNIQDKEIAQFYYKFLKDAGWTIESN